MAYDDRVLEVVSQASHVVHLRYRTRDIFEVVFEVVETGERLVVVAGHWPSRSLGKYRTDPLRAAVAEHVAYLVEDRVKVHPARYEELREQGDDEALAAVRDRWETNVLVVGDFNDEPGDRSVTEHLKASSERDRVVGETNDIDGFRDETADYRGQDVFLYNPMWRFLHEENVGTYFIDRLRSGEKFANRYQVLDQLVASRGLIGGEGLRLDLDSVEIVRDEQVATSSGRPRRFDKDTGNGVSDHLPVTARLTFE
ncbi:endonuclease/exonuclease/phosphatase family protein [Halorussus caseinilyticus]|uniref:Endonuclease/exonuclease/phosphatase domain-containing protein n=2 Tax=Halorussus caseinilyticus TaxID=3034025 RepID=A0ABD5WPS9_9EURY